MRKSLIKYNDVTWTKHNFAQLTVAHSLPRFLNYEAIFAWLATDASRLLTGLMTWGVFKGTAYTFPPSNAAQCPSLSSAIAASMWETDHCAARANLGVSAGDGETNTELDSPSAGWTHGKICQILSNQVTHFGRKTSSLNIQETDSLADCTNFAATYGLRLCWC